MGGAELAAQILLECFPAESGHIGRRLADVRNLQLCWVFVMKCKWSSMV